MSKKFYAALTLDTLGLFNLCKPFLNKKLMIFNYHRIFEPPLNTEFDEGVFAHSANIFQEQLIFLKKNFTILSEFELIELLSNRTELPYSAVCITFDDGYIDNYELAYPILKSLNIPATFFIPCNQINGTTAPWWDQVSYMMKKSDLLEFMFNGEIFSKSANAYLMSKNINKVLRIFKNCEKNDVEKLLHELSQSCNVSLPSASFFKQQFMSWDQIKELSENGMSIGSHTLNHNILSKMSDSEQKFEIETSKSEIENKIESEIYSISYPVGGKTAFNSTTKKLVQEAGYKLGFNFINGFYTKIPSDNFDLSRIELASSKSLYKAQSLIPNIF